MNDFDLEFGKQIIYDTETKAYRALVVFDPDGLNKTFTDGKLYGNKKAAMRGLNSLVEKATSLAIRKLASLGYETELTTEQYEYIQHWFNLIDRNLTRENQEWIDEFTSRPEYVRLFGDMPLEKAESLFLSMVGRK